MSQPKKKKDDFWSMAASILDVEDEMAQAKTKKTNESSKTKEPKYITPSEPTVRMALSAAGTAPQQQPPPTVPPPNEDEENPHVFTKRNELRELRKMKPSQRRKVIMLHMAEKIEKENEKPKEDWLFSEKGMAGKDFKEWKKQVKSFLPSQGKASIELEKEQLLQQMKRRKTGGLELVQNGDELDTLRKKSIEKRLELEKQQDVTLEELINLVKEDEGEDPHHANEKGKMKFGRWRKKKKEKVEANVASEGEVIKPVKITKRMQALREMCVHLSDKRPVRQALARAATGGRTTILNKNQKSTKERIQHRLDRFGNTLHSFWKKVFIWEADIKEINGHFGAVYASFFIMMRKLVVIQFLMFMVVFWVIMVPQFIQDKTDPSPQKLPNLKFHYSNLLTGEGYLHTSYLFYSGYTYRNQSKFEKDSIPIQVPAFRFMLAIILIFTLVTLYIFSRLTSYYHNMRHDSKLAHIAKNDNFKRIFCAWDFTARDRRSKLQLHKTIRRELYLLSRSAKADMYDKLKGHQEQLEYKRLLAFFIQRLGNFWGAWALHALVNLVVFICCCFTAVSSWFLNELNIEYYKNCWPYRDDLKMVPVLHHEWYCPPGSSVTSTVWILTAPSIWSAILITTISKLFVKLADSESWNNPGRKIYATMFRVGLFRLTKTGTLFVFYVHHGKELADNGYSAETAIGKELYRLLIFHSIINGIVFDGVRWILHKLRSCRGRTYTKAEFRTEYYALMMFYLHSMSIFGTLFFPPLSGFVLVRYIVDFYRYKYSLFHMSTTSLYSNKDMQMYSTFILLFYTVTYVSTSCLQMFYLSRKPSEINGPFIEYQKDYLKVIFANKEFEQLAFFISPQFLFCFNLVLASSAYFTCYWSRIFPPIIKDVNVLLALERDDRNLILEAMFEIIQKLNERHTNQDSGGGHETDGEGEENVNDFVNSKIDDVVNTMHARRLTDSKKSKGIFRNPLRFRKITKGRSPRKRKAIYEPEPRNVQMVAARRRMSRADSSLFAACTSKIAECGRGMVYWMGSLCKFCKKGCKCKSKGPQKGTSKWKKRTSLDDIESEMSMFTIPSSSVIGETEAARKEPKPILVNRQHATNPNDELASNNHSSPVQTSSLRKVHPASTSMQFNHDT